MDHIMRFKKEENNEENICPSCGAFAAMDGPTLGCKNPEGCGKDCEDEPEYFDDREEDMGIEELNFD